MTISILQKGEKSKIIFSSQKEKENSGILITPPLNSKTSTHNLLKHIWHLYLTTQKIKEKAEIIQRANRMPFQLDQIFHFKKNPLSSQKVEINIYGSKKIAD